MSRSSCGGAGTSGSEALRLGTSLMGGLSDTSTVEASILSNAMVLTMFLTEPYQILLIYIKTNSFGLYVEVLATPSRMIVWVGDC